MTSDDINIKEFIFNKNVINLLIAVVIGKLFAEVIQSTVTDIILPILNYIFNGSLNVSGLNIKLKGHTINYGRSLGLFITLLISVLTLYYIFIKPFNKIIEENDKKNQEKELKTIKDVLNKKDK
jgi:large conductance mechanosensitive channel